MMEIPKDLLLSNRLLLPPTSGFESQIETLFNVMLKRFEEIPEQYHPKLVLCRSANKHISIPQVCGNDTFYLVFDTHLIEAIFKLVLLNNKECTQNDLRSFVFNIIAENYLSKGKLNHAKAYAYAYEQTPISRYYNKTSLKFLTESIVFYEAFVIFHELSHWFSFRINLDTTEKLERHRNACLGIFTRHFESVKNHGDDNVNSMLKMQIEHIIHNDKIVEESYCDMFASSLIMEIWGKKRPFESAKHALLALRYIQFVQILNFFTTVTDFNQEASTTFFEMNIRSIVQNAYLNGNIRERCPLDLKKYHTMSVAAMEEYELHIETPLIQMMGQLQNYSDILNKEKEIAFYEEGYDELFEIIKSIIYD